MKKVFKVALIVVIVLAVALGAVAVWQWGNIKAVFMSFKYSSEEIDTLVTENDKEVEQILKSLTPNEMRSLSDEEIRKLQSGELSTEEALMLIKGEVQPDENSVTQASGVNNPETDGSDNVSVNNSGSSNSVKGGNIDDIIARIYLLRAEYVGALNSLEAEAKAYILAIPRKELNFSRKLDAADLFTGKAVALEGQCDAKMDALIHELEAELKKTGGDVGIISKVKSVYDSEKELKKSQLLSKYGKYL